MHDLRAVSEQRGEVMHVPGVARFGHQPDSDALSRLHEALVHRADREQHRNRRAGLVGVAVADHEDRGATAPADRLHRIAAQRLERARELFRAGGRFPDRAERRELSTSGAPQRRHFLREQHRMLDPQQCSPAGTLREH